MICYLCNMDPEIHQHFTKWNEGICFCFVLFFSAMVTDPHSPCQFSTLLPVFLHCFFCIMIRLCRRTAEVACLRFGICRTPSRLFPRLTQQSCIHRHGLPLESHRTHLLVICVLPTQTFIQMVQPQDPVGRFCKDL